MYREYEFVRERDTHGVISASAFYIRLTFYLRATARARARAIVTVIISIDGDDDDDVNGGDDAGRRL